MIFNARKNSVSFPRIWKGFGESSTEGNVHTRSAIPQMLAPELSQPRPSIFRERVSSISGMLQSVRNKSRPDSTTFDNYDMGLGYNYSYSTRPSIDSVNMHSFLPLDLEEPNAADKTDDDNEHCGEADCQDRTKKCFRGLLMTIVIANLWAISLHMIKLCYIGGQASELIMYNKFLKTANTSDEYFNNINIDNQLFDHVINLDTASITTTAKSITAALRSNKSTNQKLLRARNKQQILEKRYDFSSKLKFNAPFFMAWYCSLFNILFLPLYAIFRMSCIKQNESITVKKIFLESVHHFIDRDFTTIQFFSRCIFFCSLWTLANYLLVYGVRKLDPTVSMALFASSVNFIYFLSWVVLHNQFVGIRIVAAIVCTTGVSLLAYMNRIDRPTTFNVVIGTMAACAAATYKVFYRRIIGYTSFAQTALFFTIVGLLNACLLWPIVILLYLTGVEVYKTENIPWLYLNIAASLNLLANLLGNFGVLFTYELFLSLGMLFGIIISFYIDSYIFAVVFQGKKLVGIVLIAISFLVVLLPENWNKFLLTVVRTNVNKWKANEAKKKNARKIQDTATASVFKLRTPSGRVK